MAYTQEEKKKYRQEWSKRNKDKKRLSQKAWRDKNKDKIKEYRKEHERANPQRYTCYRRNYRALKRNAKGSHTVSDIECLLQKQEHSCNYCSCDVSLNYHVDHIQPLSLGGRNDITNLQILCPTCNLSKSNKEPKQYEKEIGIL